MRYLNLFLIITFLVLSSCSKKEDSNEKEVTGVQTTGATSEVSAPIVEEFSIREGGDKQIYFDFDKKARLSFAKGDSVYSDFSVIEGEYQTTTGGTVNVTKNLPKKDVLNGWDIIFTKYVGPYESKGIVYKYDLTGVLSNVSNGVEVLRINDDKYESVVLDSVKLKTFSKEYVAIGHDWKTYIFNKGTYSIVENLYFIIKTDGGNYYKMRFLNFYAKGITGNIQIEYQKL